MQYQNNDFQREMEKFKKEFRQNIKFLGPILVGIIFISIMASSYYTVQPDEEAVVIRLGKYHMTTPPGFHLKLPLGIDSVIKVQSKRILQEEFGFRSTNTRNSRTNYSGDNFDHESLMLTGDLNVANVEWVVQYQISDPFKYLFKTSDPRRNIRDISESIMRRVVGDKLVSEVLTVGRVEIANDAKILMQEVIDHYDIGIRIVTVRPQDVNPPQKVRPSFNEVNAAKQEQEKVINQAEEAYNKVIPEARGQAEKQIAEAEGYATALVNRAKGDADKFKAIYDEYRLAPAVTKRRLYIEAMENIFKDMKDITIVDPSVKGILPVFDSLQKKEVK
jgi:membrane protease subunit HflK